MKIDDDERRLVYSTDGGRLVDADERQRPRASAAKPRVPNDGVVRVFRERRRGSTVTVVTGLANAELATISAELKRRCATGGTAKNGVLELQGDHRDAVIAYFERAGRKAKKAGG